MKRLLLLTVLASLLIMGGCATVQAQSQQAPPAAGKTYVMPAEIIIKAETAKLVTDADEAKVLADEAMKNVCVKAIKPKDSDITLYLVFCGTSDNPYCPPPPPGQPKRCY